MAEDDKLSPEAAPVDNAPSPGATDDKASSSGAEQGESKESLLEAVQRAVPELRTDDADKDLEDTGASPAQVAKDKKADDDADLPDEVTPEELAKYSKTTQKRVKQMIAQRAQLTGEVQRLRTLEPSAQAADQVASYLRQSDISQDDFLMGLELMSAMRKGDFRKFYEGVRPYVRLAEEYLGVALPPDLQAQVQQGQMTTSAAAQYSRERMDRAMAQTNATRQSQALQNHQQSAAAQQQQQQLQYLASSVKTTADNWEANIRRIDPDYAAKQPAVNDTMWAVVKEQGPPQSPEHAIKILNESYKRVNQRYRQWSPQRQPTQRSPSSTGRTAGVSPEPTSLKEAVQFARERTRL